MKKLLLSLAVMASSAFGMFAETITYDFKTNDYGMTRESGSSQNYLPNDYVVKNEAASVTFSNLDYNAEAEHPVNWRLWSDGVRATKTVKGQIAISVADAKVTGVEISVTNATNVAVKNGEEFGTAEAIAKNGTFKWEGSTTELVLSFTQNSTTAVQKITITYAAGAEAEKKDAGLSFAETAVTIYADKVADFSAPALVNPNNLTVTYTSSEEKVATVAADGKVTLTGEAGSAKITAAFAGNAEYRAGEASYTITVKETPKPATSVAETVALAANAEFVVDYDLTVAYVNGIYVYAYTATNDFIMLYGTNEYKEGDLIAKGWIAQYAPFYGLPEVKPVGAFPAAASNDGKKFAPAEVAAADITAALVNHVIIVKNVEFATATPDKTSQDFTGKVGETTLNFRTNFKLDAQEAGTYNVTLAVAVYNNKVQLYPIAYELVKAAEPEVPEAVTVNSVKETIAVDAKTTVKVNYALTVGFANAGNIFACDEAGDFIQVFANDKKNDFKIGDVIPAGWEATYDLYNGTTPELLISSVSVLPAATAGTFAAKAVAPADITTAMVNSVVKIENVVFAEETPATKDNFTGKVGETEFTFRNNYTLESQAAGKYTVTVVINVYQSKVQLYAINYEKAATDGIDEIEAEAAEAVYYNLQGVEVKNPENGVYIVRRGSKVTKEYIR